MKLTKLSLIAAFAISGLYAGGDVPPPPPPAAEPATTVDGNAKLYYYTTNNFDTDDLFAAENSAAAAAVTINVSHKIMDGITANFTAVGYTDLGDSLGEYKMENGNLWATTASPVSGGYFNVANLTATFGDTTLVLGRQLLDTPMVGSFDWLLAPTGFQAYTVVNKSVEGLTLVASYIEKIRPVDNGDNWIDLTDIKNPDGDSDNYALGAAYSNGFDVSVWYYNVDAGDYTQVYADAGYEISGVKLNAQYVMTDYNDDTVDDSTAFGVKVAGEVSGINLSAAYVSIADNIAGYVGRDSLYTSSWNFFAANSATDSYKVAASTELYGVSATVSYADYDAADDVADDMSELDVILGYKVMDNLSLDVIYSMTDYINPSAVDDSDDADTAVEIIATYTF